MSFASRSLSVSASTSAVASANNEDAGDSDDITQSEFVDIMDEQVVKAELYERPLYGINAFLAGYGITHMGCAIELANGAKYMVQMFAANPEKFGSQSVSTSGSNCTDSAKTHVTPWSKINKRAWKKLCEKTVQKATVKDYVKACGKTYDLFKHNCRHASNDMFELQ